MEAILVKSDYEIERGKSMPSKYHAHVQGEISFFLKLNYRKKYRCLPELSVIINGKERVPDLAIYKVDTLLKGKEEIKVKEVPLGVVEILSPTQGIIELIIKAQQYFDAGIVSYWLVVPEVKTVYVYSAVGEYEVYAKEDLLKDTQLDIELNLKAIFDM